VIESGSPDLNASLLAARVPRCGACARRCKQIESRVVPTVRKAKDGQASQVFNERRK